jgi:hypothetical protein
MYHERHAMPFVAALHLYVSVISNTTMTVARTSEMGAIKGASHFMRFSSLS